MISTSSDSLFGTYGPRLGAYDEFFAAPGVVRPGAQLLLDELHEIPRVEMERRREAARRQIAETSISFLSAGEEVRTNRPWQFDVLPLVIEADDWKVVSRGLTQRARLLNALLRDLYGPQRSLHEGLLPPQLLFAHPGYHRPFRGLVGDAETYLHFYAADLARGPDGRWLVMADRTEAPSGAGYALENRLISAGLFPDSFRAHQVERLAPFFIALRETLQRLAVDHRDNPRIVLLSQGGLSPNYYEDAYLARYLGYMLVEGGDLAVRNDQLHLMTLGGLAPVDVVFRRINDVDCDPLELPGDPRQGTVGLLQSIRRGKVAVANLLGSALAECPALAAFLPQLCRAFLGEELLLNSPTTWWCGAPDSCQYVLAHLSDLVIRHTFREGTEALWVGPNLASVQLEELAAKITARPADYVAQEIPTPSTAPVWRGEGVERWSAVLRTYLVSSGRSYQVMPGGLARVSPEGLHDLLGPISQGHGSKDAWVLSAGPVTPVTLLDPPDYVPELKRSGAELPSRAADNLYWLGRHVERAESAARLLRAAVARLMSENGETSAADVAGLLRAMAELGMVEPAFGLRSWQPNMPSLERVLPQTAFDVSDPMSLRRKVQLVNSTAALVRERLSLDSWRLINQMSRDFQVDRWHGSYDMLRLHAQLNQLIIGLSAFSGLVAESMTRHLGWRFLDIGRRIERANHSIILARSVVPNEDPILTTGRLAYSDPAARVDVYRSGGNGHPLVAERDRSAGSGPPPLDFSRRSAALEAVMEAADCLLTYRSRYFTAVQLAPVLDLLLTDRSNPRSLVYQLQTLEDHVRQLPRPTTQSLPSSEERLIEKALHAVRMMSHADLLKTESPIERRRFQQRLSRIADVLPKFSNEITQRFLIHAGASPEDGRGQKRAALRNRSQS